MVTCENDLEFNVGINVSINNIIVSMENDDTAIKHIIIIIIMTLSSL